MFTKIALAVAIVLGTASASFAAPKGQVEGPFKYTLGEVVFEVEKVTPESVRKLGEAEAEIKTELEAKANQSSAVR